MEDLGQKRNWTAVVPGLEPGSTNPLDAHLEMEFAKHVRNQLTQAPRRENRQAAAYRSLEEHDPLAALPRPAAERRRAANGVLLGPDAEDPAKAERLHHLRG